MRQASVFANGATSRRSAGNAGSSGSAWFQCGSLQLHLGLESDFRPAKKAHPALIVGDLAELLKTLAGAGFEVNKPDALIMLPGPMIFALGNDIVRRAERLSIPAIYPFEEMAEAGGLMSYASNLPESYRRAAWYVDRILKGASPSDLPIEQPTRLWLAINLRTAKTQDIKVPQAILQRADRIIE